MSIRKGNTVVTYGKKETEIIPRDLGEIIYSSIPLKNSNYHLADGSVLNGNGIYKDFVDYMKDKYDNTDWTLGNKLQIDIAEVQDICYINNKFIAVGSTQIIETTRASGVTLNDRNAITTSTDGINWTTPVPIQLTLIKGRYYDLMYVNNKFIIIDTRGATASSTDGETWNDFGNTVDIPISSIAYNNNRIVVVGESGYITSSTDGETWTTPTQIGEDDWQSVIYDNNKFVALGINGYVSTSTDGINWTTPIQISDPPVQYPDADFYWHAIAYGDGKFIASGEAGQYGYYAIATSTDGINWTSYVSDKVFSQIKYGNGRFIAARLYYTELYTSIDGLTWNLVSNNIECQKLKYYNGTFFIKNDYDFLPYCQGLKKYNYTEMGALTNNDGVLSGFTVNDYALIPEDINLGTNFEIQLKVTWGSDVTGRQGIMHAGQPATFAFGMYQDSADFNIGDGNTWLNNTTWVDTTIDANTTYWYRITFNGSKYSLLRKASSTDSFTEIAYINSSSLTPLLNFKLGSNQLGDFPFLGSIDLNECYIKVNNNIIWQGVTIESGCFITEEEWQSQITKSTKGTCGKYAWVNKRGDYGINTDILTYSGTTFSPSTGVIENFTNSNSLYLIMSNVGDVTYLKIKITDNMTKQCIAGQDTSIGIYNGYFGYNTQGGSGVFTNITSVSNGQFIYLRIEKYNSTGSCLVGYNLDGSDTYINIVTDYTQFGGFLDYSNNFSKLSIGYGYIEGSYYTFSGEIYLGDSYYEASGGSPVTLATSVIIEGLRLPRLVGIQEGNIEPISVGDLIKAGLPALVVDTSTTHTHTYTIGNESAHTHTRGTWEIKGSFQGGKSGSTVSGVFTRASGTDTYKTGTANSYTITFTGSSGWSGSTSAGSAHSHSLTLGSNGSHRHEFTWGSTLKDTTTVQPETIQVLVYIVVSSMPNGNTVNNQASIQTNLNNKANNDFSNVTLSTSWKKSLRNLGLPSGRYIDLVLGVTGDMYRAPADGYFCCGFTGTAGSSFMELNYVNNKMRTCASGTGGWSMAYLPVRKGDTIYSYYGDTTNSSNFVIKFFRFLYANYEV